MLLLFIGVYVVLTVLVYLLFSLFKNISEQKNELNSINELINKKKNEEILSKDKKVEVENVIIDNLNDSVDYDISLIDCFSEHKNRNIKDMVDAEFDYDKEKIIKTFIKKIETNKNYELCKRLQKKFSCNQIYELSIISKDELFIKLREVLNDNEYKIVDLYSKTHEDFTLEGFINYLDELVKLNDPTITIYVNNKKDNYEYLSKYIKTEIDNNIYYGMKIGYQGKLYDFSLNGRKL